MPKRIRITVELVQTRERRRTPVEVIKVIKYLRVTTPRDRSNVQAVLTTVRAVAEDLTRG